MNSTYINRYKDKINVRRDTKGYIYITTIAISHTLSLIYKGRRINYINSSLRRCIYTYYTIYNFITKLSLVLGVESYIIR